MKLMLQCLSLIYAENEDDSTPKTLMIVFSHQILKQQQSVRCCSH